MPDNNDDGITIGSKQEGSRVVCIEVEQQNKVFMPLDDNKQYDVIIIV